MFLRATSAWCFSSSSVVQWPVVGRARASQMGGVPAESADLEDALRADGLGEEHEEFALVGRDLDLGEVFFAAAGDAGVEGFVCLGEVGGDELVYGAECFFVHAGSVGRMRGEG